MSKIKYHEYIIEHRGKSSSGYSILYNIVEQERISALTKIQKLFPKYLSNKNIDKARRKFINSFLFPKKKDDWQEVYNLAYVKHGRNFWSGTEQTGTKGVAIRDRRYKKGYRTEYHGKFERFHKHHPYTPWSELTDRTLNLLNSEFYLLIDEIQKKQKIGRILIPIVSFVLTGALFLYFPMVALIIGCILLYFMPRYFVNLSKIESESIELAERIGQSYSSQEEDAKRRYLDYDLIDYGFLT
jgi:hypothetical protein